jgi:hypothetical protein
MDDSPDYASAFRYDITLSPGQCLYLPAGWFHFVISLDTSRYSGLNAAQSVFLETPGCMECILHHEQTSDHPDLEPTLAVIPEDVAMVHREKRRPFLVGLSSRLPSFVWNRSEWAAQLPPILSVAHSKSRFFGSDVIQAFFPDHHWLRRVQTYQFLNQSRAPPFQYLMQEPMNSPPTPPWIKTIRRNFLWLNHGRIVSALHYDLFDNFLIPLQGRKRVLLFPPWECHHLHRIWDSTDALCDHNI